MPAPGKVRWAKFRVTVMAVAAVAILGVLFYLLLGGTLLSTTTRAYIFMNDSSALAKDSPVLLNGIRVGKVESLELMSGDPKRAVRVAVEIEDRFFGNIPEDSIAEIGLENLIGDQLVAIRRGVSTRMLERRGEIRYQIPEDLAARANMLAQLRTNIRAIDKLVEEIEQGKGGLGAFVRSEQAYGEINRQLDTVLAKIRASTARTTPLGRMLYDDEAYRELEATATRLDNTLAQWQRGEGAAGNLIANPAQYEDLRAKIAKLRDMAQTAGKNSLIATDATWNSVGGTLASLTRSVDEFAASRPMNDLSPYERANGAAREFEKTLREFRENPKKFLRLKLF